MAVDEHGNEIITTEPSDAEKRIKQLSGKVREAAEATEAEKAAREKAESERTEAQRERDFYQGYADVIATNPMAKDHKDEIFTKVKSGYTVEDATYAVLGKAGKLGQPAQQVEETHIGGGSSPTTPLPGGSQKQISDMSRDEKRAALIEAEKRGDISL